MLRRGREGYVAWESRVRRRATGWRAVHRDIRAETTEPCQNRRRAGRRSPDGRATDSNTPHVRRQRTAHRQRRTSMFGQAVAVQLRAQFIQYSRFIYSGAFLVSTERWRCCYGRVVWWCRDDDGSKRRWPAKSSNTSR
jgi:hypothetical protein